MTMSSAFFFLPCVALASIIDTGDALKLNTVAVIFSQKEGKGASNSRWEKFAWGGEGLTQREGGVRSDL